MTRCKNLGGGDGYPHLVALRTDINTTDHQLFRPVEYCAPEWQQVLIHNKDNY